MTYIITRNSDTGTTDLPSTEVIREQTTPLNFNFNTISTNRMDNIFLDNLVTVINNKNHSDLVSFENVYKEIKTIDDNAIRERIKIFIDKFKLTLMVHRSKYSNTYKIPPLSIIPVDSDGYVISISTKNLRGYFAFETDKNESSYGISMYLGKNKGRFSRAFPLNENDCETAISDVIEHFLTQV